MLKQVVIKFFILVILIIASKPILAIAENEASFPGNKYVSAEIIADKTSFYYSPEQNVPIGRIGVYFRLTSGWHIYWINSGESGLPTEVMWFLQEGFRLGELNWPAPYIFKELGDINTYGYKDEVLLFTNVYSAKESSNFEAQATVNFLVCKDICVPGQISLEKQFPITSKGSSNPSEHYSLFEQYEQTTSVPLEEAQKYPPLRNIIINGFIENPIDSNNKTTRAGLLVSGITGPATDIIHQYIQTFPYSYANLEIGRANFAKLSNSYIKSLDHTYSSNAFLIFFPLSMLDDASKTDNISGELVISRSITGSIDDIVLPWSINIDSIPKEIDNPFNSIDVIKPLEYRSYAPSLNDYDVQGVFSESPFTALEFLIALFSAFVAGLLLNFMPCVLPIISIKVMSLMKNKEMPASNANKSSIYFALGILFSFALLGLTVIFLRSIGVAIGWGFQFQEPMFVFTLLLIVFILSLAFFDYYTIHAPFLKSANQAVSKLSPSPYKDFFDGILVTALSTPCSAPFLGVALGFALTRSPLIIFTIFFAIGLGLAFPYAYFSRNKKVLNALPKPGPWMVHFKHIMGFLLLATAAWLLYVLEKLTINVTAWIVVLLLVIYFVIWVWNTIRPPRTSPLWKLLCHVLLIVILLRTFVYVLPKVRPEVDIQSQVSKVTTSLIEWTPYSQELVQELHIQGQAMFINFTADWCITCKFNERLVINTKSVSEALLSNNIIPIKADWTTNSPVITRALAEYNAYGVPLYVFIPSDSTREPVVFPVIVTRGMLVNTFKQNKN
jgi:thiol:disulfide interchange protein